MFKRIGDCCGGFVAVDLDRNFHAVIVSTNFG